MTDSLKRRVFFKAGKHGDQNWKDRDNSNDKKYLIPFSISPLPLFTYKDLKTLLAQYINTDTKMKTLTINTEKKEFQTSYTPKTSTHKKRSQSTLKARDHKQTYRSAPQALRCNSGRS